MILITHKIDAHPKGEGSGLMAPVAAYDEIADWYGLGGDSADVNC